MRYRCDSQLRAFCVAHTADCRLRYSPALCVKPGFRGTGQTGLLIRRCPWKSCFGNLAFLQVLHCTMKEIAHLLTLVPFLRAPFDWQEVATRLLQTQ